MATALPDPTLTPERTQLRGHAADTPQAKRSLDYSRMDSMDIDRAFRRIMNENKKKNLNKNVTPVTPNLSGVRKRKPQVATSSGDPSNNPSGSPLPDEEWELPKNPSKRRQQSQAKRTTIPTDDNRFNTLNDNMDLEEERSDLEDETQTASAIKKPKKPPPIFTANTNMNTVIKLICNLEITKKDFTIREKAEGEHVIYTNEKSHYDKIVAGMKTMNIQFFTYTPKDMKPKSFLIKGIRGDFSVDDIKTELKDLKIPNVEIIDVFEYNFDRINKDKHHHLVQIANTSSVADLFKVRTLVYQRIRWEHLRKPSLFQCRRCQRIGHASKNCSLQFRCVKCAQSHEPGKSRSPKKLAVMASSVLTAEEMDTRPLTEDARISR